MKRLAAIAVVVGLVGALAAAPFGGWALVSIQDAPDYLLVGKPNTLTFQVRAHGRTPVSDVKTFITARSGWRTVDGRTWQTPIAGTYKAVLNLPSTGDWTITIRTNWGKSRAQTLSWPAVRPGDQPPVLSEVERGRRIFASRGCVTCHVHRQVDIASEFNSFGPNLSDHAMAPAYLAQFLADPSIKARPANGAAMPNLRLADREISSLAAFLTSRTDRVVGARP